VTKEDLLQVGFGLGADNTLHAAPCAVTITPINGNGAFHYRITLKLPLGKVITATVHASAIKRHDDDEQKEASAPGFSRRARREG
jgi:hypothetical protein